jgi:hypothetical protein
MTTEDETESDYQYSGEISDTVQNRVLMKALKKSRWKDEDKSLNEIEVTYIEAKAKPPRIRRSDNKDC